MTRRVTWDSAKAEANFRKHKVSFELAATVFDDPLAVSVSDRIEDNELRWRTVGIVRGMTLLVVAHTVFDDVSGDETIRLISARRAEPWERRAHERE